MVGTVQNLFGGELLKSLLDVKVIWLQECILYIFGVLFICASVQCIGEYEKISAKIMERNGG